MDEMSAAVGITQLEKLDWMIEQRRKVASLYEKYLKEHSDLLLMPRVLEGNIHTWFVYTVQILGKKVKRDKVIQNLAKRGISSKPYLPSIHLFDFYKKMFKYKVGDFPISEKVSNSSIALPFYISLKDKDVKFIVDSLVSVIKEN
jgi:perosamine synthetase